MRNAKQQSDNVNNILSKIDNVDVLSSGFSEIQCASIVPFQLQLKETQQLVKLNKHLKKSTIMDLNEFHLKSFYAIHLSIYC